LRRWQAAIVGNLFGWKRVDEANRIVRRYRRAFVEIGRGNGKTPLASGIVLYCFLNDEEPGQQNYLAAGQREQAGALFRNGAGFVDQDKGLTAKVKLYRGKAHRSMVLKADPLSFVRVIPADAAGQHGGIPHVTVVDELHVQESRDLLDVFETAMAKKVRRQPLLVMITTSDYDRESICNEVYDYACRVRDNGGDPAKAGYDPAFLPVIYEAQDSDPWTEEKTWEKANPNLDVSVSREQLAKACKKAQETPAFENAFKRLHLNIRTGQDVRVIPMEAWDQCPRELSDLVPIAGEGDGRSYLLGRPAFGGLDLASTEDLASLGLAFPLANDYVALLSWSWCPEDRVRRRARQKFPYDVWAAQGFLEVTPGDQIDYRVIRSRINELAKLYDIREIGFDPHGATHLMQDLKEHDGISVVPIPQSFRSLAAPTKELVRLVRVKHFVHFGNPVVRWAASNAAAHFDGRIPPGAKIEDYIDKVPLMLSKRKSANKIDPIAAAVLALATKGAHPDANEAGAWDGTIHVL